MVVQRAGAAWLARVAGETGPIYAAIVRALDAAIRDGVVDVRGRLVGIVLTGGNVDLDKLPW